MWTTKLPPTAVTGSPVASMNISELSMSTWPWGSQGIRKTADGSAATTRSASYRLSAIPEPDAPHRGV